MDDKLLILDLDECLIHSQHKNDKMSDDFIKNSFDVLGGMYRTMKRPYLDEFLDFGFENFSVAVWTAASGDYATEVINNIGIVGKLKFLYSEKNCTPKYDYGDGWGMGHIVYHKNISKLTKRGWNMNNVLMVDDKPEYIDSYGNVIKIEPFEGDLKDSQLLKLIKYLDKIKDKDNFRSFDKRGWDI
jgi:TFIIF-interacting CTD phosphatase-like protein